MDSVVYPVTKYIMRICKSSFLTVEDCLKRSFSMMCNRLTHKQKLFLIFGVATCFSIIAYRHFVPNNLDIPRKEVYVEKYRPPPICGFYHFSTIGSPWRAIVHEQMLLIHISGLLEASANVYVTGLGKIEENNTIYEIFANPKFIYEYESKIELYEYPTLKKVEKYCLQNNDSLVWYAQSKGASRGTDEYVGWRGLMNHFVLKKWRMCHGLLSTTNYTTCGAILTFDSVRKVGWNTYYAGNMWWAKCSHINKLTRIEKFDQNDRYMAEIYVTSEPDVGHFNCYNVSPVEPWTFNVDNITCSVNQPLWKVR